MSQLAWGSSLPRIGSVYRRGTEVVTILATWQHGCVCDGRRVYTVEQFEGFRCIKKNAGPLPYGTTTRQDVVRSATRVVA